MNPPARPPERCLRLFWIALYLLAALCPLVVGVVRPGITGHPPAMLPDMIHGRAHQPFVKRQLVPLIVRAGLAVTPQSLDDCLRSAFERSSIARHLRWPAADAPEFVLTLAVMYAGMVGFMLVLRRLLVRLLTLSDTASHAVVLALAAGLPVTYAGKLYLYDFTQLLLFTAGLWLMHQRRWRLYYPVFALACLNKETSILLAGVFACWQGRRILDRPNLPHLLAQGLLGLAILAALAWVFRDNPGSAVEWHLKRNLSPPVTRLAELRLALLAAGTLAAVWSVRRASPFVGRGFLVTLLPLLIATLFFGYLDELRDYYEAAPLGLALALMTFAPRSVQSRPA